MYNTLCVACKDLKNKLNEIFKKNLFIKDRNYKQLINAVVRVLLKEHCKTVNLRLTLP